jgi:hypothetical protein
LDPAGPFGQARPVAARSGSGLGREDETMGKGETARRPHPLDPEALGEASGGCQMGPVQEASLLPGLLTGIGQPLPGAGTGTLPPGADLKEVESSPAGAPTSEDNGTFIEDHQNTVRTVLDTLRGIVDTQAGTNRGILG